jgi:hypothetical protein
MGPVWELDNFVDCGYIVISKSFSFFKRLAMFKESAWGNEVEN